MENKEEGNMPEPHINIFNNEVGSSDENKSENNKKHDRSDSCCSSKHHSSGVFGLIILFIGIFLLLSNLGFVSREIWVYIIPFWPVILVLIGIKIILGSSRVARFISFLLALVLLSLIFLSAMVRISYPYNDRMFHMGDYQIFIH